MKRGVSGEKKGYTRKISPRLGILGFLGFLGFIGLIPDLFEMNGVRVVPFPLLFFCFFGFFGFYYEGKMSGTMMDERYVANANRAAALANKAALTVIIGTAIAAVSIFRVSDSEVMVKVLIGVIGLAFGLSVFLQEYLLYRFEHEE